MTLTRVDYRERQVLRQADLVTDQAYHIAMRHQHTIAQHGWGIVLDLKLVVEDGTNGFRVNPGMAIDGFGRELIVPHALHQDWPATRATETMVDVWLHYATETAAAPHRGRSEQSAHQDRLRETAVVRLTPAGAGSAINPRQPPGVSIADLNCSLAGELPLDPARDWPVYLGRVQRINDAYPFEYRVLSVALPYATLVGELIETPPARPPRVAPTDTAEPGTVVIDERVRVQIGQELPADRRRFSIATPDSSGKMHDRVSINRDWRTTIAGPVTVIGDPLRFLTGSAALEIGQVDTFFNQNDLRNPAALVRHLQRRPDEPTSIIWAQFSPALRRRLQSFRRRTAVPAELIQAMLAELNSLLERPYPVVPAGWFAENTWHPLFNVQSQWPYDKADFFDLMNLINHLKLSNPPNPTLKYLQRIVSPPDSITPALLLEELNRMLARMFALLVAELFRPTSRISAEGKFGVTDLANWTALEAHLQQAATCLRETTPGNEVTPRYYYLYCTLFPPNERPNDFDPSDVVNRLNNLLRPIRQHSYDELYRKLFIPDTGENDPPPLLAFGALLAQLRERQGALASYLRHQLKQTTLRKIDAQATDANLEALEQELRQEIWSLVQQVAPSSPATFTPEDFAMFYLGDEQRGIFGQEPGGDALVSNRLALEAHFADEIVRRTPISAELRTLHTLPTEAMPRSVYHAAIPAEPRSINELRLEIENPGNQGDPANCTLVIGAWSDVEKNFAPCLSIAGDCSVVLHGNVVVEGQVIESPVSTDLADQRFVTNQTALQLATNVDTRSLRIGIEFAITASTLSYTLILTNTSVARISDLAVYETLIERGETTRLAGQVAMPRDYLAGDPNALNHNGEVEITARADDEHELVIENEIQLTSVQDSRSFLVITAMGIGPALNVVYATDSTSLQQAQGV